MSTLLNQPIISTFESLTATLSKSNTTEGFPFVTKETMYPFTIFDTACKNFPFTAEQVMSLFKHDDGIVDVSAVITICELIIGQNKTEKITSFATDLRKAVEVWHCMYNDIYVSIWNPETSMADNLLLASVDRLGFNIDEVLYDVATKNINSAIISYAHSFIYMPVEHSRLCGSLRMWRMYRESPTNISEYVELFSKKMRPDVSAFFLKNADTLMKHIDYDADFVLNNFATTTLIMKYLSRVVQTEEPREILQFAYMRIAIGAFCREAVDSDDELYNEIVDFGLERNIIKTTRDKVVSTRRAIRTNEEVLDMVLEMYKNLSKRVGTAASPTFFNLGFKKGAPSSCILLDCNDTLKSIASAVHDIMDASRNYSGVGITVTRLRTTLDGGVSSGGMSWLRLIDITGRVVDQGGRREGAVCASMRIMHCDIMTFINCVNTTLEEERRVKRLNTSVIMCDLFFDRLKAGKPWSLFCPSQTGVMFDVHDKEFNELYIGYEAMATEWEKYTKFVEYENAYNNKKMRLVVMNKDDITEFKCMRDYFAQAGKPKYIKRLTVSPRDVLSAMSEMQVRTGMPYIIHGCTVNRRNNMCNIGNVAGPNLCQEIIQPTIADHLSASCNIASLCLKNFVDPVTRTFDYIKFGDAVRCFVRFLDHVIDNTGNLEKKVRASNALSRPMGLGVSGFGDMCNLMRISPTDPARVPIIGSRKLIDIRYDPGDVDYSSAGLSRRKLNPELAELNWKIWSCMYYNALLEGTEQAAAHGKYPAFDGSKFSEGKFQYDLVQDDEAARGSKYPYKTYPCDPVEWGQGGSWVELKETVAKTGLRNAMYLTIMPTASSAQIIEATEGIEFAPHQLYIRNVSSGDYYVMNTTMISDFIEMGIWGKETYSNIIKNEGSILNLPDEGMNQDQLIALRVLKERYLTMWEISKSINATLCAQRQVFIEQSISMNLFYKAPSVKSLMNFHVFAHKLGLKTGCYYIKTHSKSNATLGSMENHMDEKVAETTSLIQRVEAEKQREADETKAKEDEEKAKAVGDLEVGSYCTMEEGCISCSG